MERVMRMLDLDPNSKAFRILRSLVRAGRPLSVREMMQLPGMECDTPGKRTALYRSLTTLQKMKVVMAINEPKKTKYYSDEARVRAMIAKQRADKLKELNRQKRYLMSSKSRLEKLTSKDVEAMATHLVSKFTEKKRQVGQVFMRGESRLLRLLHEQMMKRVRRGDTLRISVAWGEGGFFAEVEVTMRMLKRLIERGTTVKILGPHRDQIDSKIFEAVKGAYTRLKRSSSRIEIRLRSQPVKTYDAFLKNHEFGILIIGYNPEPLIQLIPYDNNPELLSDIAETFEDEFTRAIPLWV